MTEEKKPVEIQDEYELEELTRKKYGLTEDDMEFARLVFIEGCTPLEAFKQLKLNFYKQDYNSYGNVKKKGEEMSESAAYDATLRKTVKVEEYGKLLLEKQKRSMINQETYARDTAIQTCLANIQMARKIGQVHTDMIERLDKTNPLYPEQVKELTATVAQSQRTVLSFLQELNKLQKLYEESDTSEDKVTLEFNDDATR